MELNEIGDVVRLWQFRIYS